MKKHKIIIGVLSVLSFIPFVYAKGFSCPTKTFHKMPSSQIHKKLDVNSKQILRRGNGAEPESLNPNKSSGVPAASILIDLFDPLFRFNVSDNPVPAVAKSWHMKKVNKKEYAYTFCLKESYWSNGQPVKASDFVYAYRAAVDPKGGSPNGYLFASFVNANAILAGKKNKKTLGVRALADNKLEIRTVGPVPYIEQLLAMPAFSPVYPPVIEKYGDQWTKPEHMVTNGAFVMIKWVPNDRIVLEKSMTYWDAKNVKLNQVVYYAQSVAATGQRSYEQGAYDFLNYTYLPAQYMEYLKTKRKKIYNTQYAERAQLGTYFVDVNVHKAPVNNLNLRKALYLAYNHKALIDYVLHGANKAAYSFVPPGINDYLPVNKAPQMRLKMKVASTCGVSGLKNHKGYVWIRDLTAKQSNVLAKCYYKKAGYSSSRNPKLNYYYNTSEQHKIIALNLASMFQQTLGVKTSLLNVEWKVFLKIRRRVDALKAKSPIILARDGWIGDYNDPYTFLGLYGPDSGNNNSGYYNKTFIQLLSKSKKMVSIKKRAKVLAKAEQMLLDDYAIFPIYYYDVNFLVKPYVIGFEKNKLGILGYIPSRFLSIDLAKKANS